MSSNQNRDEKRISKNLSVTSRCLAIVLTEKEKSEENVNSGANDPTASSVHNGKELLEDFKLRNKTCYWNPALVESIKNLGYKGFVEPSTILVSGNEIHLENLRTAWGRRVLKPPAGFSIEKIGDVNGIEMQVIPQTQFIPLPDALCLIIMDLNNRRIVATLDTIKEKLLEWYRQMTMPSDQLIFDTLGNLIQERKVFHSGSGYFVVTPETYRLPSDDPNISFNTSWLPYHPMYIPVFPQIQTMPSHLQHLQQQLQHRVAPMRSISCQANMHCRMPAKPAQTAEADVKKTIRPRARSHSVRVPKNREKEREKAAVIDSEEALKRTMSVRYKGDKVKDINKDINLKTSNINQEKEKGEKEKTSLFSKIFGRNKKKNAVNVPAVVKEVEYATFSAQFPPPEWHWYQQQVEKQRRTEEWVSQQIAKSCSLRYLHNIVPAESTVHTGHYSEARPTSMIQINHAAVARVHPQHVLQENNNNTLDRRGHTRRTANKTKREKTVVNDMKHKENQQTLFVNTYHDENVHAADSLSPVAAIDETIYESVRGGRVLGPKHSTPRFYDTIPIRKDIGDYADMYVLNNQDVGSCHPHVHHQRKSHRSKRKSHRNSLGYYDVPHQSDISYEYKGKMPTKNSVYAMSRDSGVNCIGMSSGGQSNDMPDHPVGEHQGPVIVRNKLDNLDEESADQVNPNNTMASDFQAELPVHATYGNCYDSSMNDDPGVMRIVCEAEINHKPIPEIVLDTEPRVGPMGPDVAEAASNSGSRDALSSEKSCDTVVPAKQNEDLSHTNDSKSSQGGCVRDLSLVDSGFSSPRTIDSAGTESNKQCNRSSEGFTEVCIDVQSVKGQPQVPHNSPQEKCLVHVEHRHKHSTHMLNNQRHSRGHKYESALPDSTALALSQDLHVFQQQQLTTKRFGINGEFEVVGVV